MGQSQVIYLSSHPSVPLSAFSTSFIFPMHWKGQGRGGGCLIAALSGELKDITSQSSITTEGMLHQNNVFGYSYTDELNVSVIQLILTPETEKNVGSQLTSVPQGLISKIKTHVHPYRSVPVTVSDALYL